MIRLLKVQKFPRIAIYRKYQNQKFHLLGKFKQRRYVHERHFYRPQEAGKGVLLNNIGSNSIIAGKPFRSSGGYYKNMNHDGKLTFKEFQEYLCPDTHAQIAKGMYNYTENFHKDPRLGSLIEARDARNRIHFGVCVKQRSGNYSSTELEIVDITGALVRVSAHEITFHMNQLVRKDKLDDHGKLKQFILYFCKNGNYLAKVLSQRDYDDVAYSKLALHSSINGITIDGYIEELPVFSKNIRFFVEQESVLKQNDLNKFLIFFSVYLIITDNPARYIVSTGNNSDEKFSNFVPNVKFMTNSIWNSLQLEEMLIDGPEQPDMERFTGEVKDLMSKDNNENNKFYKWINNSIFLTEKESQKYQTIFNFLKYYIIYPHEKIELKTKKIIQAIDNEYPISSNSIFNFLCYFGVYKQDTDIFLSNNILATVDSKSISTVGQLLNESTNNEYIYESNLRIDYDVFHRTRAERTSVAYILSRSLAVSLDKIGNEVKVNVHVPDIGSFICPNSNLLYHLLINGRKVELPSGTLDFVPKVVSDILDFQEHGVNFCLTFSFWHDPWKYDQYDQLKVEVSVERLANVQVVKDLDLRSGGLLEIFQGEKKLQPLKEIYSVCKAKNAVRRAHSGLIGDLNPPTVVFEESANLHEPEEKNRRFLIHQLQLAAGEVAGRYCDLHNLPMYIHGQQLMEQVTVPDHREVKPRNLALPNFKAFEYEHFAFSGPLESYFAGMNFLEKETVGTASVEHRGLGMKHGYAKVSNPMDGLEQLMNQWQILLFIAKLNLDLEDISEIRQMNNHGFDEILTAGQLEDIYQRFINPRSIVTEEIQFKTTRYWTLKWVQSFIAEMGNEIGSLDLQCMITHTSEENTTGYWIEMGLYVEIINLKKFQVGEKVQCLTIKYLDPVEGRIIMESL